ncbi:MAG: hypothetical protein IJO61_04665 [Oscillospiraceae bacterium]|nr:hypothetical protein [Oscillospiraceae bacterium]
MKRTIALILVIVMSIIMVPTTYAANVCSQISGNCNYEKTFTVNTKNFPILSEKITLTQTKGKYEYRPAISASYSKKVKTGYMAYNVYYKKSGDSKWKSKKWTGKNCSITLKKNSTYTIRVVPYNTTSLNLRFGGSSIYWRSPATWSVSKTRGVDLCY